MRHFNSRGLSAELVA